MRSSSAAAGAIRTGPGRRAFSAPAARLFLAAVMVLFAFPGVSRAVDAPEVTVGGEVRMRGYYLNNFLDFADANKGDEWSVFRLRTRVFVRADLERNVTAYIRIANQHYSEGVTGAVGEDGDRWEEENKSNKFFVDAAYVDVKDLFGLPFDVQAGRQNLMYGSGWVIFDGQSQFGSTSAYMDGVRAVWRVREDIAFDALYFKDEEKKRDNTSPDDITLTGLYLTSTVPLPTGKQELYALGRKDESIGKEIYMFGARLSNAYEPGVDYSAEGAWQTGKFRQGIDQAAWGLKLDLGFKFKDVAATPRLFGGFVRLTGNDYGTPAKNESWDVYYGGWPQYGDLLVWKYINAGPENAIVMYDPAYNAGSTVGAEAVYSNFDMFTGGVDVWPLSRLKTSASYSKIAAHRTFGGADRDIGDYYQLTVEYRYSKHLQFGMYAALIDPGAAFGGRNDPASEAFWDVTLNF
jgi:hypothetical protein